CAVIHAGAEHDASAWSCRAVRRLWNAGHGADAHLPARAHSRSRMERGVAAIFLLVAQRRTDGDVPSQFAAGGADADLGVGGTRLLVRPQRRIPADAAHAESAVDACPR